MSWKRSYYRIDRTFLLDESGTLAGASFVTSSKQALVAALPTAIHGGKFPDDNLVLAWAASVKQGKNFLSDLWISDLHIKDGTGDVRTMKLIPDVRVHRRDKEFRVTLVEEVNDLNTFDVHRVDANGDSTSASYASLAALGRDLDFLACLGGDGEPVEVDLDQTRLIDRIPPLAGNCLSEPFPFRPFHDNEEFRDFVSEQLPDELADAIPDGRDWQGYVPLETWFPASSLLEACDDAGCGNFDFW